MTRVKFILVTLLVFAGSFLTTVRQADAGCDNKCRARWRFLQLGAGGWCAIFTKSTCVYCVGATTLCDNTQPPEGANCVDSGIANTYITTTSCGAVCLPLAGTTISEANAMAMGNPSPTANYRYCQ